MKAACPQAQRSVEWHCFYYRRLQQVSFPSRKRRLLLTTEKQSLSQQLRSFGQVWLSDAVVITFLFSVKITFIPTREVSYHSLMSLRCLRPKSTRALRCSWTVIDKVLVSEMVSWKWKVLGCLRCCWDELSGTEEAVDLFQRIISHRTEGGRCKSDNRKQMIWTVHSRRRRDDKSLLSGNEKCRNTSVGAPGKYYESVYGWKRNGLTQTGSTVNIICKFSMVNSKQVLFSPLWECLRVSVYGTSRRHNRFWYKSSTQNKLVQNYFRVIGLPNHTLLATSGNHLC